MTYWHEADVVMVLIDQWGGRVAMSRDFKLQKADGDPLPQLTTLTHEMVKNKVQKGEGKVLQSFITTDGKLVEP